MPRRPDGFEPLGVYPVPHRRERDAAKRCDFAQRVEAQRSDHLAGAYGSIAKRKSLSRPHFGPCRRGARAERRQNPAPTSEHALPAGRSAVRAGNVGTPGPRWTPSLPRGPHGRRSRTLASGRFDAEGAGPVLAESDPSWCRTARRAHRRGRASRGLCVGSGVSCLLESPGRSVQIRCDRVLPGSDRAASAAARAALGT